MIKKQQEVELAGPLNVNEQRAKVAQFTNCLESSKIGIITGITNLDRSMFMYPRIFSWKVWAALLLTYIATAFILLFLYNISPKNRSANQISILSRYFLILWSNLTGHDVGTKNNRYLKPIWHLHSFRILLTSWLLGPVVNILFSFQTSILSTFAVTKLTPIVSDLDQLQLKTSIIPIIFKGSSVEICFKSSKDYESLWQRMQSHSMVFSNKAVSDNMVNVEKGTHVILLDYVYALGIVTEWVKRHRRCSLQVEKVHFCENFISLALRKDIHPKLVKKINTVLSYIMQAKLQDRLLNRVHENYTHCTRQPLSSSRPLNMTVVLGVFVLWSIGMLLSEVELAGPLNVNEQWAKVAQFTNFLESSKIGIITGITNLDRSMFMYPRIFSWKVWAALLLTYIATAFILLFLYNISPKNRSANQISILSRYFLILWSNLTGHDVGTKNNRYLIPIWHLQSFRILLTSWLLGPVVNILFSFQTSILSTFAVTKLTPIVSDLDQLQLKTSIIPIIFKGSSVEICFKSSKDYESLWQRMQSHSMVFSNKAVSDNMVNVEKGTHVILLDYVYALGIVTEWVKRHRRCSLQVEKVHFCENFISLALRKDIHPKLVKKINTVLSYIMQAKLQDRLLNRVHENYTHCTRQPLSSSRPLNMTVVLGVFVLWSIGMLLSVLSFFQEMYKFADVMKRLGQKKTNIAKWVCLAKFASGFNTQALSQQYKDGSYDFGVFQINDKFCKLGSKYNCGVSCTDLVKDDITPSARCALKIFEKNGFKDWPAWKNSCQDIDTSRFIVKCSLLSQVIQRRSHEDDQSLERILSQY
ncbi:hypothetical protein JTE90_001104 [Oedothorax gibbosus]|uniref:Glycosyl hydrolases family 22 (GH22) domain-containing protein n=1 Tax=Oedothorax gibbosus TaxID=931172 RepID=A0AAV6VJS7_9ARAC|nr:hypothetical protein JTE90_001104 [Oedothorax gibbosus]